METFCLVGLQTNDLRARLPLNHEISVTRQREASSPFAVTNSTPRARTSKPPRKNNDASRQGSTTHRTVVIHPIPSAMGIGFKFCRVCAAAWSGVIFISFFTSAVAWPNSSSDTCG